MRGAPALAGAFLLAAAMLPAAAHGQTFAFGGNGGVVWISRLATAVGTLEVGSEHPLPVQATLRAQDAPVAGVMLAWRPSPRWEVRMDGARARTAMAVTAELRSGPGGPVLLRYDFRDQGDARLWWLGAGAAWRLRGGGPARPRLDPYLLLQGGITHWSIRGIEELPELSAAAGDSVGLEPVSATLPAAGLGVGVDAAIGRGAALRLELVDVVGADPLEDEDFHLGSRFAGTVAPDDLVHTLRLTAGLRLALPAR